MKGIDTKRREPHIFVSFCFILFKRNKFVSSRFRSNNSNDKRILRLAVSIKYTPPPPRNKETTVLLLPPLQYTPSHSLFTFTLNFRSPSVVLGLLVHQSQLYSTHVVMSQEISYIPSLSLPPEAIAELMQLGIPLLEDLHPNHLPQFTVTAFRKYIRVYGKSLHVLCHCCP